MASPSYASGSFLDSLSGPDGETLLRLGHEREWQRGEALIRTGEQAESAIVLLSGLVKIHKTASDGQEVVFGIAGPGDLLGEVSATRRSVRSASVTAQVTVTGRVVMVLELRSFLEEHNRVCQRKRSELKDLFPSQA